MPFYEYQCQRCSATYIDLRPVHDRDKPVPCPDCGSAHVRRKVSTFATSSSGDSPASNPGSCNSSGFG